MRRFLIYRLVRAVVVLWGVTTVVFVVAGLSGDPVTLLVPLDTPVAEIERLRHELGLDAPISTQYLRFLSEVSRGDFGRSIRYGEPVMGLVLERLGPTLELATASLLLAISVAIPVGVFSVLKPNSLYDRAAMAVTLLGQSTPTFLAGILLILVFSVQLRLLPSGGRGRWLDLVLPAATLGAWAMASIARLTRTAMLEVIHKDYIRTARAKGLGESAILVRHALKNAAIPLVTIVGLQLGALLAGAVVVETVFSWPGMGRLMIQAIGARDYPVVQAGVFLVAAGFVVVNFLVDLSYAANSMVDFRRDNLSFGS
ncbi:MAG TPA: ABC transporter permease [Methylomirabilota bacterium]|jgi:peptide/nickel transport system permease protein|nr:ABC transporter permease [Methylomirabilota bacterium]